MFPVQCSWLPWDLSQQCGMLQDVSVPSKEEDGLFQFSVRSRIWENLIYLFTCMSLTHLSRYKCDPRQIHLLGRLICLLSSSKWALLTCLCQSVMYSPKPKCTISSTDPMANRLTRESMLSLVSFYSWFSFWTLIATITLASFLTS